MRPPRDLAEGLSVVDGLPGVFLAACIECYLALPCVQRYPAMPDPFSGACDGSWHGSLGGQLTRMTANTATSASFGTTLLRSLMKSWLSLVSFAVLHDDFPMTGTFIHQHSFFYQYYFLLSRDQ